MTLFTAEGILRAETKGCEKGIFHPTEMVFSAYQRWLITQGYPKKDEYASIYDGWLLQCKELYNRRAPGSTCLSALSSGKQGSIDEPLNDSKGCGGVMRVAPAGLFFNKELAFQMGAEFAALTHGHPSGYLSTGALTYLIALIIEGLDLESALLETVTVLENHGGHEECKQLLQQAFELARQDLPDVESISTLGQGWVGEEALSIAVYCALKHKEDFKKALIAAVNHDGDSDSTGAITGNILGAYLGVSRIPEEWAANVELKEVLMQVAGDLFTGYRDTREWRVRYPGD